MFIKLSHVPKEQLADLTTFMLDKNHQLHGLNGDFPFAKIKSASIPESNSNGTSYNVTLNVTETYFKKTNNDKGHTKSVSDSKHITALWKILTREYKE